MKFHFLPANTFPKFKSSDDVFLIRINKSATGPKYDGVYLKSIVQEILGDITIDQTLTDVVIPTFDIKTLQPIIFSTDDV